MKTMVLSLLLLVTSSASAISFTPDQVQMGCTVVLTHLMKKAYEVPEQFVLPIMSKEEDKKLLSMLNELQQQEDLKKIEAFADYALPLYMHRFKKLTDLCQSYLTKKQELCGDITAEDKCAQIISSNTEANIIQQAFNQETRAFVVKSSFAAEGKLSASATDNVAQWILSNTKLFIVLSSLFSLGVLVLVFLRIRRLFFVNQPSSCPIPQAQPNQSADPIQVQVERLKRMILKLPYGDGTSKPTVYQYLRAALIVFLIFWVGKALINWILAIVGYFLL